MFFFHVKDSVGGTINVLNLMEVVMDQNDSSSFGWSVCDYFHALCQQSFPGPLVGGNVGNRELNKWIDEKIANFESPHTDYRKGEVLRLLFSLLKIACQYYGKLRSPFGTDQALMVRFTIYFSYLIPFICSLSGCQLEKLTLHKFFFYE